MARKRLSMRKIKDVLRLKAGGLSHRAIARSCLIGKETVREYLVRAAEAGVSWPLPEGLGEEELEHRLFPHELKSFRKAAEPDWSKVHQELRKKGVTRQLLWKEYREGELGLFLRAGAQSHLSGAGRALWDGGLADKSKIPER